MFLLAGKFVLESRRFADWLNQNFVQSIAKRNDVAVSFESLSISLVNKRIMFMKVVARSENINFKGNVGFGFHLEMLISRRLNLSKIIISDADLNLDLIKEEDGHKLSGANIFSDLDIFFTKNFLKEIELNNISVNVSRNSKSLLGTHILSSNVRHRVGSGFNFLTTLENVKSSKLFADFISISGEMNDKGFVLRDVELKIGLSEISSERDIHLSFLENKLTGKFKFGIFYNDFEGMLEKFLVNEKYLLHKSKLTGGIDIFISDRAIDVTGKTNFRSLKKSSSIRSGSVKFDYDGKNLSIGDLMIKDNFEGEIKSSKIIFDTEEMRIINSFNAQVKKFRVLSKDNYIAKKVGVNLSSILNGGFSFDPVKSTWIFLSKNFSMERFCIFNSKGEKTLCLKPVEGNFQVVKKSELKLDFDLLVQDRQLKGKGTFQGNNILIKANKFNLNHIVFDNLLSLDLISDGTVDLKYTQTTNSKKIIVDGKFKNLSIEGYNLGRNRAIFSYDFKTEDLRIDKISGLIGESKYLGHGEFSFLGENRMDLNINFESFNINNLQMIMPSHLGGAIDIIRSFNSFGRASVKIIGPLDIQGLKLLGYINGKEITLYQEDFSSYSAVVELVNKKLKISPFTLFKGDSAINGTVSLDLQTNDFNVDLLSPRLTLNDFYYYRKLNLGLKTDILFNASYSNLQGVHFKGKLFNSSVRDIELGRSEIHFKYKNYLERLDVKFFDQMISVDGRVDLAKKGKPFKLDAGVRVKDLEELLGVVSVSNLDGRNIKGSVNFDLSTDGKLDELNTTNLELNFNEFSMRRDDLQLSLMYPYNKINIKNGELDSSKILLSGRDQEFLFEAVKNMEIIFLNSRFRLPGSIFEVFPQFVQSWKGETEGGARMKVFDFNTLSFYLGARRSEFKLSAFPTLLSNSYFNVFGDLSFINIEEFSARVGGGKITLDGSLQLSDGYPKLDINYNLSTAQVAISEKSSLNVGGFGRIFGDTIPYFFNGSLNILSGEISDDPNFFLNIKEKFGDSKSSKSNFFDYNIEVKSISPIKVRNSLADFGTSVNLKFAGDGSSRSITGKVSLKNEESKIYFKGHEFKVLRGNIFFRKSSETTDPYFDVLSETKISDYNLEMEINGDLKNLNVKFRSDPPLAEPDILSLLTLGITLDTSRELQDSELESVTSMSLGSLLIDQFGINQGLNDSLGIKLSVGPEFSDENVNPIAGKINNNADTARLRSATKLRLSKRISNSIDLNYSSTLGGSLDQSQQMNINFKINSDVALQGVYRTQTNENSESIDNNESIGFDLIWKKTFK